MAAAYAYHICQNHPFVDGNKRVGLVSALVFLELNGIQIVDPESELYDIMINIAKGKGAKQELSKIFRKISEMIQP
jgi:death on curing protein